MRPDDTYSEKQTQKEMEKLKQKVNSLSPKDKQQIYEKGQMFNFILIPQPSPNPRELREMSR